MNQAPVFHAIILFLSALGGAVLFLVTQKQTSKGLKLLLTFSAAYLLGLTLLHLFPEMFASEIEHAGWYVLGGFLLQVVLDFFSHGIEHGHTHTHTHAHTGTKFLYTVMASLWVHAFIEGMPFGGVLEGHAHHHSGHEHAHAGHDHRDSLLIGISLHKVTEALVFTALLVSVGLSKKRALFWLVIFALVAPAGAFAHYYLGNSGLANISSLTPKVTGVLIGILLHVSTTILFESEEGHRFNLAKFGSILLGIGMAAAIA
ncbi:MAG: ZIP family metal transporter [Flavobacteriales bacterium]